jgi:hypothetical protein
MTTPEPHVFYDENAGQHRIRIKTVGDYHIEIIPMIYNWRLHTIRVDADPWEWSSRHWCYEGRDKQALVAAVLAAQAWDGADDTEPVGWIKSWDGRYGGRLAGHQPVRI